MIGRVRPRWFARLVIASLVAVSPLIAGCSKRTSESTLDSNKSLVRYMNEQVWNQGNLDVIDELYAADFIRHFLPDGSELRGIDSFREHVRQHREAFPDWREEIQHIVADGDLVVLHFVSTGTNDGSWRGSPATGMKIRIHEMSILRIEGGRIAEQWLMPDIFSMQQQLARANDE